MAHIFADTSSYLSIILLRSSLHRGRNIPKPNPEFALNNPSDNTKYSQSSVLRKQVEELTEKTDNTDYLLRAKLQEKDDALVTLSDQVMKLMAEVQELKKQK